MEKPGKQPVQEQAKELSAKEAELAEREAQLKIREEEYAKNLKNLNMFKANMGKEFDAADVPSGAAFTLAEIKGHGPELFIETDSFKMAELELERFMNELVTINIAPSGDNGALEVVTPTVNGINQPIIRGIDQKVKRKYVEALARTRVTNYQQSLADPSRPENIQMTPRTSMTYPFMVREDRNPRGRAWLEGILNQPA